jgi:hypothetical protein
MRPSRLAALASGTASTMAFGLVAAGAVGCMHSASDRSEAPIGTSTTVPSTTVATEFDDSDPGALALFHPELAPYGTWTNDEVAGTVWVPRAQEVGEGFVPYASHGHFAYREAEGRPDFVWVSDVSWGWVTFHYGRWTYLARRGTWAWVPGRRYSGAWVTFRMGEGCANPSGAAPCMVGWGPRAPHVAWHGEEAVRRPAVTSLFVYARAKDLFEEDLSSRLLRGDDLERASRTSELAIDTPHLAELGIFPGRVSPPVYDADLRKAWLYATPDSARAMGLAPSIGRRPLRTFVAGGPRYHQNEEAR